MRLERLLVSSEFLEEMGFSHFFDYIVSLELLTTFNYNENSFFALQRIVFKEEHSRGWERALHEHFPIKMVQEISRTENVLLCIVRSESESAFIPFAFPDSSWAIIPPVYMDAKSIIVNVVAEEAMLAKLHDEIARLDPEFKILALDDLEKTINGDGPFAAQPKFTPRQQEIARYAMRNGYFRTPKRISATQIANHFDISISAVNEHLRKARQLAMEFFFS